MGTAYGDTLWFLLCYIISISGSRTTALVPKRGLDQVALLVVVHNITFALDKLSQLFSQRRFISSIFWHCFSR